MNNILINFQWLGFPQKVNKYLGGKKNEHQLTYDGHEGVKVAYVEAFARHVDEELDDPSSVLLLHRLLTEGRTLKVSISPQDCLFIEFVRNQDVYLGVFYGLLVL